MTANHLGRRATADRPIRGEHDSAQAERHAASRRDAWSGQPRCTRCGRWIGSPGGAGFGDGQTFCDPCAVRLDFERGDGRTR